MPDLDTQQTAEPVYAIGKRVEVEPNPPFLGKVVVDEWASRTGFDNSEETYWKLYVRPSGPPLKNETGCHRLNPRRSRNPRSTLVRVLDIFSGVFRGEQIAIGEGNLVGRVLWWRYVTFSFGRNENNETISVEVLVPARLATQEEINSYTEEGGVVGDLSASAANTAASAPVWTDEEIAAAAAWLDGKAPADTEAVFSAKLPVRVKQGIVSGTIVTAAVEQGKLIVSDGKFNQPLTK